MGNYWLENDKKIGNIMVDIECKIKSWKMTINGVEVEVERAVFLIDGKEIAENTVIPT